MEVMEDVSSVGSVMVAESFAVQLLASVTVTIYLPAVKPLMS